MRQPPRGDQQHATRKEDLPERVVVEWPGGPYDFALAPQTFTAWLTPAEHKEGWFYVTGWVVQPSGAEHRVMRTLYAERIGPERFRMIPMRPWPTTREER